LSDVALRRPAIFEFSGVNDVVRLDLQALLGNHLADLLHQFGRSPHHLGVLVLGGLHQRRITLLLQLEQLRRGGVTVAKSELPRSLISMGMRFSSASDRRVANSMRWMSATGMTSLP